VAADMPCCAISHAATARQRHAACLLDSFAELACGPAPLLVLVGRAMELLLAGVADERVEEIIADAVERVSVEL